MQSGVGVFARDGDQRKLEGALNGSRIVSGYSGQREIATEKSDSLADGFVEECAASDRYVE